MVDLLHIETEPLDLLLATLRAVIHVREGDAIYPINASLRDFLTDSTRCTDSRVFVDPSRYHSMISRGCLDFVARHLKKPDLRDVCQDGKDLFPYACRYWARHLADPSLGESLVDRLHDFTSTRLLYWVECLSLLDGLDLGINGLNVPIKVLVSLRWHGCEQKLDI